MVTFLEWDNVNDHWAAVKGIVSKSRAARGFRIEYAQHVIPRFNQVATQSQLLSLSGRYHQ